MSHDVDYSYITSHTPTDSPILDTSSHIQDLTLSIPSTTPIPRVKRPPTWLNDYYCHSASINIGSHWCNLVSYDHLAATSKAFIAKISSLTGPTSYTAASKDENLVTAMQQELKAFDHNHTWDVVALHPGKTPIGCRWVYKVKLKANDTLEGYQASLVAKGYNQRHEIDYEETLSLVVKMATVRSIIDLAASFGWTLYQLDVNNAFIHGDLHEEGYMQAPTGLSVAARHVCKLTKSLYGLKQTSRQCVVC